MVTSSLMSQPNEHQIFKFSILTRQQLCPKELNNYIFVILQEGYTIKYFFALSCRYETCFPKYGQVKDEMRN